MTSLDELVSKITEDHRIEKKIEEPLAFNIFSTGGQSTTGLNGKFVFSQVLIDCLLRLKSTNDDQNELNHIKDFQRNYQSTDSLEWYSKECFFYKTLNSVLRTENIHWMFLYRSFIFDIQQQLQLHQLKQILHLYRTQIISNEELQNLNESVQQFISINSFFSTTLNYSKALSLRNLLQILVNLVIILMKKKFYL